MLNHPILSLGMYTAPYGVMGYRGVAVQGRSLICSFHEPDILEHILTTSLENRRLVHLELHIMRICSSRQRVHCGDWGNRWAGLHFSLLCDPGGLLLSGGHWSIGRALSHMTSSPVQGNQLLVNIQAEASLPSKSQNRQIPFVGFVC